MPSVLAVTTKNDARLLTDRIRRSAEEMYGLIVRAFESRAWELLGYPNWDAYCATEFDGARLRLPAEKRRPVVELMREAGMSTRAIGSALGVDHKTVVNDARAAAPGGEISPPDSVAAGGGMPARQSVESRGLASPEAPSDAVRPPDTTAPAARPTVVGLDGKRYTPPPPKPEPTAEQVLDAVLSRDTEYQAAALLADLSSAVLKVGKSLLVLDPAAIGAVADADAIEQIGELDEELRSWFDKFRKATSTGKLRVVKGGA